MVTEFRKKSTTVSIIALILYPLTVILFGSDLLTYLLVLFSCLVAFGIYSMFVVFSMAASFNDCVKAKDELTDEIQEAMAYFEGIGFTNGFTGDLSSSFSK